MKNKLGFFCDSVNSRLKDGTDPFSINEMRAIFNMHLERINSLIVNIEEYLCKRDRAGYFLREDGKTVGFVSRKRLFKFRTYLKFSPVDAFETVNKTLINTLETWPLDDSWILLSADESMVKWISLDHKWVLCIPRKPSVRYAGVHCCHSLN